ncbi:LysR family transcriptional regulator [Saccharospirillum sp. MSK14-1]|uniref:LysR family transcriptional regulator n=1 Tax=Saccharospirillum sp. MSK14-1 TaxID=1897632 RepID=UPI001304B7B1|nr:LysR family transcriptional regulator [Saccharospirillum sp. MSK14-1]
MDKAWRQFLAVAELRSVSLAAQRLFVSQPTLTHNLKKLESQLGVTLFNRSPRGMTLTSYGETLLEQARIMQRVYDNALGKLQQLKVEQESGLRIGVGMAWWHLFFRDLFQRYREQHPTAPAHIEIGNHLRSMDQLLAGELDLFIGHRIAGLNPNSGAVFTPLFKVRDACFVRTGHPLLGRAVSFDDLLDYPHLAVTPDETRYSRAVVTNPQFKEAEHHQYHLADRVVWSTSSMSAALDILRDSDAVMIYPESMTETLADSGVVPLALTEPQEAMEVGVYRLEDRISDDGLDALVEEVKLALVETNKVELTT